MTNKKYVVLRTKTEISSDINHGFSGEIKSVTLPIVAGPFDRPEEIDESALDNTLSVAEIPNTE